MYRTLYPILGGVGLLVCGLPNAVSAQKELPDFTAELHVLDHLKVEMYNASVAIGKYGARSESSPPRFGKMITIANPRTKTCRTYLVEKKAYYEEALDPKAPDCDLDLDRLFGEYADTLNTYSYNALGATAPCTGYTPQRLSDEDVYGRITQKWLCTDPTTKVSFTQWFDVQLGRVIKHQEAKITKEYRNIVVKPQPESLFTPLPGYRAYSQNAFYDLLRIPAFSAAHSDAEKQPDTQHKLLPNDRLQICMEKCQTVLDACAAAAKSEANTKQCDAAFDQCAANCEKNFPPE
jgi:hypothetical protein